ncbi:MAG: exosortase system-associated protein, TIGR04073 family [Nitrospirota bacterium]
MSRAMAWAVMLLALSAWTPVSAHTGLPAPVPPPVPELMGQKFLRGAANVTTAWAEIPKQIYARTADGHPILGPLWGLFDGIGMTFVRVSAGVFELGSFFVPLPRDYEPLLQPAYVWQTELHDRADDHDHPQ